MTQNPDHEPADPATDESRREGTSHGLTSKGTVKQTRAGAWWTALVLVALLSIVFLVFIAQNADAVTIAFLGFEGELSLAVALLLSAALGALVVAIPGMVRMLQLRRALAKNAKGR